MINQLRHEACSGSIEDLAHVTTHEMMADVLTKTSAAKSGGDALIQAIETGILPNVDKHPGFRELMKFKHKAFTVDLLPVAEWLVREYPDPWEVVTFLSFPIQGEMRQVLYDRGWNE